ncbi:FAD-dependent oxidoreductase [Jiangella alba]|uniref:FAD dependent oxidoreductase n=1 Tax=Jiangella alba TaxID=561176 RepID=A0A1H5JVD7_9ACTN|nr:FAD-dependent oxidoreductase [Jiangella alba]SEE56237.1 FAD dependent oxidoreductase [Jiangella alba]
MEIRAWVHEEARELPVLADVDVLVCGGGPAGTAAAIASARSGSKTLLLERHGFLGGMATAGLVVPHWDSHQNGGVNADVIDRLGSRGGWGAEGWKISFDPELWKHVSEDLVLDSGSDLLYHTFVVGTLRAGRAVKGVVIETKSGRFAVLARVVVDCTGDGDVAARAGAHFEKGRDDGLMQPMTTMFRLGGVTWVQRRNAELRDLIEQAIERTGDEYRLPYDYPWAIHLPNPGEVAVMLVHVRDVDGTDVRDLTRAEIDGRRQTLAVVDFLRRHVAEFADAHLIETAPQVGVRETRRITGEYVLTGDDVASGRSFEDAVATVSFPADIHEPAGTGQVGFRVGSGPVRRGRYDIPYRALIPRDIDQLVVAGRCISGTFEAHASYRVKGPCMAMGQAAGVAASLSASSGVAPRDLAVRDLRRALLEQNVKLDTDSTDVRDWRWETVENDPTYRPDRGTMRQLSAYHGPG